MCTWKAYFLIVLPNLCCFAAFLWLTMAAYVVMFCCLLAPWGGLF